MYHVFVLYLCTVAFPELGLVDAFHRITQSGKAPLDLDFGVKPKASIVHSSLCPAITTLPSLFCVYLCLLGFLCFFSNCSDIFKVENPCQDGL